MCGITLADFWNYSIDEIKIIITSYNQKQREEMKWQAQLNYSTAILIGRTTSAVLSNGKTKIPKIYELFPNLFEREKPPQQDWRIAKERLMNFANSHNKQRGEKLNDS